MYPFDQYEFGIAGWVQLSLRRIPGVKPPKHFTGSEHPWFWLPYQDIGRVELTSSDDAVRLAKREGTEGGLVESFITYDRGPQARAFVQFTVLRPVTLRIVALYAVGYAVLGLVLLGVIAVKGDLVTQIAAAFGYVVLVVNFRNIFATGTPTFPTVLDYVTLGIFATVIWLLIFAAVLRAGYLKRRAM
jgi:hypothetical protein